MSLVMGAAPQAGESKEGQRVIKAKFNYGIDVIADSPFGRTGEGKAIVMLLRSLNSRGNIVYGGNLEGSRGDWDGKVIRIDERFRENAYRTIIELVHEGTHALWRKNHPLVTGQASATNDDADDEWNSQANQLIIYQYLKETKGCPEDPELELRLERRRGGTGR